MERTKTTESGVDVKKAGNILPAAHLLDREDRAALYKQGEEELIWAPKETQEEYALDLTKKSHTNTFKKLFGPRFLNATFDNYNVYAGEPQKTARELCRKYAEHIDAMTEMDRNTLILAGKSGTGKNHLAYAIGKQAVQKGLNVEAKPFLHIMQEIKQSWAFKDIKERELLDNYIAVDLLMIEEIGVSFDSDTERIYLFDILDGRYKYNLPTIIITNYSDDEFYNFIDFDGKNRLKDRFAQTAVVIPFDWESYRTGDDS